MIAWMFVFAAAAADPRVRAVTEAMTFEHGSAVIARVAEDLSRADADFDEVLWRWALGPDLALARLALPHLSTTRDLNVRLADLFATFERAPDDADWIKAAARTFDEVADHSVLLRDGVRAYARVGVHDALNAALLTTRAWSGAVGADARRLRGLLARDDQPLTQAAAARLIAAHRQPAAFPVMIMTLRDRGPGLTALLREMAGRDFRRRHVRAVIPLMRAIKLDRRESRRRRALANAALFRLRGGTETPHPRRALAKAWEHPLVQGYRQVRATAAGLLDRPRDLCARLLGRN